MAVAHAMPEEVEDYEEDEQPKKQIKKKKKKKKVVMDGSPDDENWLKASILMGIFVMTIIAVVAAFAYYIFAGKSGPAVVVPTQITPTTVERIGLR